MATHVSNIEDMLAQGLDYLVVAPIENNGLEGVLKQAADAGVPVILTGRTTNGEYMTTVYSDQAWEGESVITSYSIHYTKLYESRRYPCYFFEQSAKIRRVIIAYKICNLICFAIGCFKKLFCPVDSNICQVINEGLSYFLFKYTTKIAYSHVYMLSYLL